MAAVVGAQTTLQAILIFVFAVLAATFFGIAYKLFTAKDLANYLREIERRQRNR